MIMMTNKAIGFVVVVSRLLTSSEFVEIATSRISYSTALTG